MPGIPLSQPSPLKGRGLMPLPTLLRHSVCGKFVHATVQAPFGRLRPDKAAFSGEASASLHPFLTTTREGRADGASTDACFR